MKNVIYLHFSHFCQNLSVYFKFSGHQILFLKNLWQLSMYLDIFIFMSV